MGTRKTWLGVVVNQRLHERCCETNPHLLPPFFFVMEDRMVRGKVQRADGRVPTFSAQYALNLQDSGLASKAQSTDIYGTRTLVTRNESIIP